MTISTFVGLIEKLVEIRELSKDIKKKMQGVLKEPGISAQDRQLAEVMIMLAERYDEGLRDSIAGTANLALTHGNEPHDKILEAMSK